MKTSTRLNPPEDVDHDIPASPKIQIWEGDRDWVLKIEKQETNDQEDCDEQNFIRSYTLQYDGYGARVNL